MLLIGLLTIITPISVMIQQEKKPKVLIKKPVEKRLDKQTDDHDGQDEARY